MPATECRSPGNFTVAARQKNCEFLASKTGRDILSSDSGPDSRSFNGIISLLQNSVSFAEALHFPALWARTKVLRNLLFSADTCNRILQQSSIACKTGVLQVPLL